MGSFIDARCSKCQKRVGWFGTLRDQPPCPRCGAKPDLKAVEHDEAEMEAAKAELRLRKKMLSDKTPIKEKVAHVKSQGQTRPHHCHWPGCKQQVPPAMWGCRQHWYSLPQYLRNRIWAAYRPGQEKDMRPSDKYLQVAEEVQQWIKQKLEEEA